MSRIDRAAAVAVTATLWAGVLLVAVPERAALVGHVWLVVVLAVGLGSLVDRLRRAIPRRASSFDAAFATPRRVRARPAALARVERDVALATGTAFDVHFRLRPLLRSVASGLLLRRGVDLERRPDRAQGLLGSDVWELVRPDRAAPDDRTAPGLQLAAVEKAVEDLERLAWS